MQHLDTHVLAGTSPEARQATTRPTSIKKSLAAIVETEVSSPSLKRSLSDSFSCMDRLPASHFECQSRSRTPFDETELRSPRRASRRQYWRTRWPGREKRTMCLMHRHLGPWRRPRMLTMSRWVLGRSFAWLIGRCKTCCERSTVDSVQQ